MKTFFTVVFCFIFAAFAFGIRVSSIRFEGLQTVEESYLKQLVSDYVNVELNDKGVQDMLRKIFDTGYFSSLTPNFVFDGVSYTLVVKLEENPKISDWRLDITGPGLVNKSDLESVVTVEKNKALNLNKVRESLQKIKSVYDSAGYFLIEVGGDLDKDVYVLKVVEYALWEVYFDGEIEGIDFSKIRKEMTVDTLKDFYTTPSFLRILLKDIKKCYPTTSKISEILSTLSKYVYFAPETSLDFEPVSIPGVKERAVRMKINVVQRKIIVQPKSFNEIRLAGNSLISSLELLRISKLVEGQVYSNSDILKAMQSITELYDQKGFVGVSVQAKDLGNVLEFQIFEKYVKDIRFDGMTLTKPYVIKDLLTFEKNEPLKKQDFYDTMSALNRTQFFESVSVYPVIQDDPRHATIVINVKEKERKFNLTGGVAWTPPASGLEWYQGFAGQVSLSTINPFGYGESFSFEGELGFSSAKLDFTFSIRRPFDIPAILGANVSYQKNYTVDSTAVTFDKFKVGGSFSTLRLFGHSLGFGTNYEYRFFPLTPPIQENTLILSASYSYDTRNNILFPTEGQYMSIGLDKSGLFGILDDRSYWKAILDARFFTPLLNNDIVLAFRVYGASLFFENYKYKNDFEAASVPESAYGEYILFHGVNSVRGLSAGRAKAGVLASAELRYDLKSQVLPMYLVGFVDAGGTGTSLSNVALNLTAGPELDVVIPMFGALSFGVAYHFDGNWAWENFKTFFRLGSTF